MTLVTAPTGSSVGAFSNGTVYDLKNSLSVRAEPISGVASVIFKLDGAFLRTENYRPYVAAGNKQRGANPHMEAAGGRAYPHRHPLQ